MNLMQKICASSEFGAFSIPLYAMNKADSQEIEKLIKGLAKPDKKAPAKDKSKPQTGGKRRTTKSKKA